MNRLSSMCRIDNKLRLDQRGFTLVEMAIVLVIIGVILSALSIAKDLQRDAEYDKIYQKFIAGWKQSYDTYYKRTGVVIGDSQTAPTYMVNGSQMTNWPNSGIVGANPGVPGLVDLGNMGQRICEGQGYAANSVGAGDPALSALSLHDLMDRHGIRMPPGRAEGMEDRYKYLDSNGNPAELQICFQWNPDRTVSGAGNVLVIRGLTPDLARTMDQLVDGKPDAIEGRFRQQNAGLNNTGAEASSQRPGVEWASNNTFSDSDPTPASATGAGENEDENRVDLLTAHWIMDQ